jgi:hypothetical protein
MVIGTPIKLSKQLGTQVSVPFLPVWAMASTQVGSGCILSKKGSVFV